MTQIRNLGVSIAIDDFGTGYSSLSYLNKLPVDSLKIDQSFLRNLQQPEGSLAVIQSIVRMAHSMNLTVVAEGVETRAELDLVRVLGCDKVQGHVYGPARRREQMEALLGRQRFAAPSRAVGRKCAAYPYGRGPVTRSETQVRPLPELRRRPVRGTRRPSRGSTCGSIFCSTS